MEAYLNAPPELIERLTQPLLKQGEQVLYLAECCGKLVVSIRRLSRCGKCNTVPTLYEMNATSEFSVQPAAPAP